MKASTNRVPLFKDEVLDDLAAQANVAQFISFEAGGELVQRFSRVTGFEANHRFSTLEDGCVALLNASAEGRVNVRSFRPEQPQSNDFLYGLADTDLVIPAVKQFSQAGLVSIVNETVDVLDGGVSGVALGPVIEFAPGDTPRAVEKPGILSIDRSVGLRILQTVYGFTPSLEYPDDVRVEFSVHPIRRGYRREHTIVWEAERVSLENVFPGLTWPNRFSRFVWDKAFGLLVAHHVGLKVPATTVVSRVLPPFAFGTPTGTNEIWIRTAPTEPVPGQFPTQRGWLDPYQMMVDMGEGGSDIQSVLSQEGVDSEFSGGAATSPMRELTIEGVRGTGEAFMQGTEPPAALPSRVESAVAEMTRMAEGVLGPVRIEWAFHDGTVWVLQLHQGALPSSGRTIWPGAASHEHHFDSTQGLEALRSLVGSIGKNEGVVVYGDVGVTSHFGDVLRRARVPSRIASPTEVSAQDG
jgi:hypothetical protein